MNIREPNPADTARREAIMAERRKPFLAGPALKPKQ